MCSCSECRQQSSCCASGGHKAAPARVCNTERGDWHDRNSPVDYNTDLCGEETWRGRRKDLLTCYLEQSTEVIDEKGNQGSVWGNDTSSVQFPAGTCAVGGITQQ